MRKSEKSPENNLALAKISKIKKALGQRFGEIGGLDLVADWNCGRRHLRDGESSRGWGKRTTAEWSPPVGEIKNK